jgi:hypothetical protein
MKTSKFIKAKEASGLVVFVPPTVLWEDGIQTREQWLNAYFREECVTISRSGWVTLSKRHEVKFLIEENGRYREEIY